MSRASTHFHKVFSIVLSLLKLAFLDVMANSKSMPQFARPFLFDGSWMKDVHSHQQLRSSQGPRVLKSRELEDSH